LYFVNFVQLLGFGLLPIAYFIIFANLSRSLLNEIHYVRESSQDFLGSQWFSVLILAALVFPLIIKKKIQELKIAGIMLFSGVILFIVLMLILRLANPGELEDIPLTTSRFYEFHIDKAFISSLSTAFVAYGFQSAFFPIYNSLEKRNYRNGMMFTFYGIGFCFIIYMGIMFISLYSFGLHIDGDVLVNVEEVSAWESYVLRVIFLLVISSHTPFIFFIGKESLLALIALVYFRNMNDRDMNESGYTFEEVKEGNGQDDTEEENSHGSLIHHQERRRLRAGTLKNLNISQRIISNSVDYNISTALPFYSKSIKTFTVSFRGKGKKEAHCAHDFLPGWIYYSVTLGLYGAIITAGCLIKDVEIVIKFIGSLANSTLNFTFPGIFFFVIMTRAKHIQTSKIDLMFAVLLAIYGVVMGFGLTGVNVWTTISPIKIEDADEFFFTE
jgi:amino acid permease